MNQLLENFIPQDILNWDDNYKSLTLLGTFNGEQSLLILRKKPFAKEFIKLTDSKQYFHNDIYTKYILLHLDEIDCELISPATQSHIDKYKRSSYFIVTETPEMFAQAEVKKMSLEWVYNILEHKKEIENIVFENKDFLILKDYKFANSNNMEDLHLLALPFQRDITSLRDLRQCHLPMLNQIYNEGVKIINQLFNLNENQIRVFIHYQPSFYHFHVHFTHITQQGEPYRDHLLNQVIQNLELCNGYYQNVKIQYLKK